MYETPEDIHLLQALLDRSIEQAGAFLRQSFQMPNHSLSARQLIHVWQGMQTIALATVTRNGEPRVAPIGAIAVPWEFLYSHGDDRCPYKAYFASPGDKLHSLSS